ncbi:assimilatory sulfite reductase (NADPH) flavoprotein subunit [Frateuria aurantia]
MPAPVSAPVAVATLQQLDRLLEGLDGPTLQWLSGYIAGRASLTTGKPPTTTAGPTLTVLYGSQTGNAKRVAESLVQRASQAGLPVRLVRADSYAQRELKQERLLYIVISTQGEGEPPDDARGLVEFIAGRRAPQLPELHHAVLGLGDSSYPEFCAIGKLLDERLTSLGSQRLFARGDADVDVDSVARGWLEQAIEHARQVLGSPQPTSTLPEPPAQNGSQYNREHPFAAEVLANQAITGQGSERDIRHLELSLAGSGLSYEPGDALGVWAPQASELVDAVLQATGLAADQPVEYDGVVLPLRRWLTERRELTVLTRPFLQAHAELSGSEALRAALEPAARDAFSALVEERQVLDVLLEYPAPWSAEALVGQLRPLAPRMYSIASSPRAVDDEVHLTVAHVHYVTGQGPRWGVASHHLQGLAEGDHASVFIEANDRFRLPDDPGRDIIMIGPGTGVAPFRAFVQERSLQSGSGRNWLFFGNPHAYTDFLYQLEWHDALRKGHLHRLDVAFSRDQDHKVYVQQRLREHGAQLFEWLQAGAYIYVCGDANRMARDVHEALIEIAREHGGWSDEAARTWIGELQQHGRYLRDVY